ncbi:MAG: hypothetical protein N4A53_07925 [Pelagimonas sp.]|jgi:hypothetical protein|nr:hypothetical protein [Pelagimonas sp.]
MSLSETSSQIETAAKPGFLSSDMGILAVVALFLVFVVIVTLTFGLPGLSMIALTLVPIIFATLILITVGK